MFYVNSIHRCDVDDNLVLFCKGECDFNKSLSRLPWSVSVPLAVIVRTSRTTSVIAKVIMLMLGGDRYRQKMFPIFESNMYLKAI